MRTGLSIWVLGAFLAVATLSSARAQEDDDWRPREGVVAGQIEPLDRILPVIRRNHPGTFYDAEGPFTGSDGEMHYRLKWMTPEGRVIWFDANARTGQVLGAGVGRRDYGAPYGGYGGGYNRPPGGSDYGGPNDGGRNNFGAGDDNGDRPYGDRPNGDRGFGGGGQDRGPGSGYAGRRGQDWGRGGHGGWPGGGGRGGGFGGGHGGGHHGHGG